MRAIYSLILLILTSLSSSAQRDYSFLPSKRNFVIKYTAYDGKNRKEYSEVWKLVGKSAKNQSVKYNIESEITTAKQNTFYQYFHQTSKDSTLYIGTERYLDPILLDSYQKMVVKISADSISIPLSPKVGQLLPEGTCKARILRGTGSVLISLNVLLINRKVDAIEQISTPAGKFTCFRISSDKISFSGISKHKSKLLEWYAINIGLVRMEEYHNKGKLISYKHLDSLAEDFFLP